jgi:hypothetical protein
MRIVFAGLKHEIELISFRPRFGTGPDGRLPSSIALKMLRGASSFVLSVMAHVASVDNHNRCSGTLYLAAVPKFSIQLHACIHTFIQIAENTVAALAKR